MKFTPAPSLKIYILGSQLLEILQSNDCFTVNDNGSNTLLGICVYNDLPDDFNYSMIARNNTSFIFKEITNIDISNDTNNLLKNALSTAYPEYNYI